MQEGGESFSITCLLRKPQVRSTGYELKDSCSYVTASEARGGVAASSGLAGSRSRVGTVIRKSSATPHACSPNNYLLQKRVGRDFFFQMLSISFAMNYLYSKFTA